MDHNLPMAVQEKKSVVIKAQGEAESAKLIGNAVKKDPAFIELRRIEAAKEIAEVVNKSQNKLFLSTDSLMLNIMDSDNDLTKKVGFFFTVVRCFLIFLLLHVAFGSFFLVLFHGP